MHQTRADQIYPQPLTETEKGNNNEIFGCSLLFTLPTHLRKCPLQLHQTKFLYIYIYIKKDLAYNFTRLVNTRPTLPSSSSRYWYRFTVQAGPSEWTPYPSSVRQRISSLCPDWLPLPLNGSASTQDALPLILVIRGRKKETISLEFHVSILVSAGEKLLDNK